MLEQYQITSAFAIQPSPLLALRVCRRDRSDLAKYAVFHMAGERGKCDCSSGIF